VVAARSRREGKTGIESFLQQYGLASQEGVVLCASRRRCCASRTRTRPTS
jgi:hypothetical protein